MRNISNNKTTPYTNAISLNEYVIQLIFNFEILHYEREIVSLLLNDAWQVYRDKNKGEKGSCDYWI